MLELDAKQVALLERLVTSGFTPVAFPLYADAIGIRRGSVAALIAPQDREGFRILGGAHYLLDGNPSVKVVQEDRLWFVFKGERVEATPDLLEEVERFMADLVKLLQAKV